MTNYRVRGLLDCYHCKKRDKNQRNCTESTDNQVSRIQPIRETTLILRHNPSSTLRTNSDVS